MPVGIVAVSHSLALAEAARDLAMQMVSAEDFPLALAAGTAEGDFGTDAVAVADAITNVDQGEGVVVLVDLGSAILSAEMALEFLPDPDADVRIVAAPFVEGLLAACIRAATGGNIDQVASEARGALQAKTEQLSNGDEPAPREEETRAPYDAREAVEVINPMGLHARPAATVAKCAGGFTAEIELSLGAKTVAALSPLAVTGLGSKAGDEIVIGARGEDAEKAVAAIKELIAGGFGEAEPGVKSAPAAAPRIELQLGIAPGRVIGPVKRLPEPIAKPEAKPLDEKDREAAIAKLTDAVKQTGTELSERSKQSEGSAKEVLAATAELAADPAIIKDASELISSRGIVAEAAVWEVLTTIAENYQQAGGALAERATDVRDIRARIVARLTGQELPQVPQSDTPFILVADDLAPSQTALLDVKTCLGIVLNTGGPTSHTAILARALGIPAVINTAQFKQLADDETVLIDGADGTVEIDPSPALAATARETAAPLSELEPLGEPVRLKDGREIAVLGNIGGPGEAKAAMERGAEGIGLFRSEFCFLGRTAAPTVSEQSQAYGQVFAACGDKKVIIRTLDAGSDKPLPFLTPEREENPALGVRGIRALNAHPQVLSDQLRAIAKAAKAAKIEPWVMAPMIATVGEAKDFIAAATKAGLDRDSGARLGIMLETPAAALMAEELFEVVDFVSIGTNDLTQYVMAADRTLTGVAALNSSWQPAVLRLIGHVAKAGAKAEKPVGVCGEAAGDQQLAAVLAGLGVTSLSVAPAAVPMIGRGLRQLDFDTCEKAAAAALGACCANRAREKAAQILLG